MKTLTYTADQIVKVLEQAERSGQTVTAICREYGIAEATFYRWRKTYAGMPLAEVLRLKELGAPGPLLPVCRPLSTPITIVTRLRLDAAFYEPAPARKAGTTGRPRIKGQR